MRWFMELHQGRRPHDWPEFREAVLKDKLKDKCLTKDCSVTHTVRQCLVGDKAFFSPRCGVSKHHIVDGRMCQECRFRKSESIFDLASLLASSHGATGPRGKKRKADGEGEATSVSDLDERLLAAAPAPVPTKIAATSAALALAAAATATAYEDARLKGSEPGPAVPIPLESVVIPSPTPVPIAAMLSASEDSASADGTATAKSGRGSRAVKPAAKATPNAQLDILALAAGRRAHE